MKRLLWLVVGAAAVGAGCRSCQDLSEARAYRCERDAGEAACPGPWRCGLDGFCFDPAEEQARACESDLDCAPDWRCGREQVCHPRGETASYACVSDDDCECGPDAGCPNVWRCGIEGRCLNASLDGLRPNAQAGSLIFEQVNPQLSTTLPTHLAISNPYDQFSPCDPNDPVDSQTLAFISNGSLTRAHLVRGKRVFADGGWACDGGAGELVEERQFEFERVGVSVPAQAIAQLEDKTLVLSTSGGLCTYGPQSLSCQALSHSPNRLRLMSFSEPSAVMLSSNRYAFVRGSDLSVSPPELLRGTDGGPLPINDMVGFRHHSEGLLVAATPQGVYYVSVGEDGLLADGGWPVSTSWKPTALPNLPCELDAEPGKLDMEPLRFRIAQLSSGTGLFVQARSKAETPPRDHLLVVGPGQDAHCPPSACACMPAAGFQMAYVESKLACTACANGATLEEFWAYPFWSGSNDYFDLEVRCAAPDGGALISIQFDTNGCSIGDQSDRNIPDAGSYFTPVLHDRSNPMRRAMAGPNGELWMDEYRLSTRSVLLDRLPRGIIGDTGGLLAYLDPLLYGEPRSSNGDPRTLGEAALFVQSPGAGLVSLTGDAFPLTTHVEGRPYGALLTPDLMEEANFPPVMLDATPLPTREIRLRLLGRFTDTEDFKKPFNAATQSLPDGGTLLLATAFDALLAVDATAWLNDGDAGYDFESSTIFSRLPVFEVKSVPLTRSPITSFTAIPPQADASGKTPYTLGYLLTSGRIFRFKADSSVIWRVEELPEINAGDPLEVWHDGPRGRVGFKGGAIYSLPSQVQIGASLPLEAGEAKDFAAVCHHSFALTDFGVWRLVSDGTGPVGAWQQVGIPHLTPEDFPGARLYATRQALFVITQKGKIVEARGWSCDG